MISQSPANISCKRGFLLSVGKHEVSSMILITLHPKKGGGEERLQPPPPTTHKKKRKKLLCQGPMGISPST